MYANKFGHIPHNNMVTGPDTFADGNTSCKDTDLSDPADKIRILAELTSKNLVNEIDPYDREFHAFGALGSNAHKGTSATGETVAEKSPAPKSEERTFDELSLSEAE